MQNTRFEIGSQEEYLIFTERCCSSQLQKKSEYTVQIQKCQSVCIAWYLYANCTKYQQMLPRKRSLDFRVWTGLDECWSVANVATSPTPSWSSGLHWAQTWVVPNHSTQLRLLAPQHFADLPQWQTHRFTPNGRGNGKGNERYFSEPQYPGSWVNFYSYFQSKENSLLFLLYEILVHLSSSWASWVCSLSELQDVEFFKRRKYQEPNFTSIKDTFKYSWFWPIFSSWIYLWYILQVCFLQQAGPLSSAAASVSQPLPHLDNFTRYQRSVCFKLLISASYPSIGSKTYQLL